MGLLIVCYLYNAQYHQLMMLKTLFRDGVWVAGSAFADHIFGAHCGRAIEDRI